MTLEAIPGREQEVEEWLTTSAISVQKEPGTIGWYAVRLSTTIFGIFATFGTEAAQTAHLCGELVRSLSELTPELFITAPHVQYLDVLAARLPGYLNFNA